MSEFVAGPLFEQTFIKRCRRTMDECVGHFVPRAAQRDPADQWWIDMKASDEFLDCVFCEFFRKLELPNLMRKTNYHVLARFVPENLMDPEIKEMLDAIMEVANKANPRSDR